MYIWKLINKLKKYQLTLVAGKNGLNRRARWYHIVEEVSFADFLIGDEIIFTTGMNIGNDSQKFLDFVKRMHTSGASGFVINIGGYVSDVPLNVVGYCNENKIPIFTMPWQIRLVDVGRSLSNALIEDERFNANLQNAVNNALLMPYNKNNNELFEEYGFTEDKLYSVVIGDISNKLTKQKNNIIDKIAEAVIHLSDRIFITLMEGYIAVILANEDLDTLYADSDKIYEVIDSYTSAGKCVCNSDIKRLSEYYSKAKRNLLYNKNDDVNKNLYSILFEIGDRSAVEKYCKHIIGSLLSYDRSNNSNLLETLKCYFDNNSSVYKVAESMYLHRNTVNYKIRKAQEILGLDFSRYDDKFAVMLALKLYEIYFNI